MKILKVISLVILFAQVVGCKSRSQSNAEAVVVSYYSGLGVYHIILGGDSATIKSILDNKRPLTVKIDEYADGNEVVADKAAIWYLEEYVVENCNTKDSSARLLEVVPTFLITTFTKTGKSVCLLNDPKISKAYFEGMLQWIQKSKYKDSLKEFTGHLQAIVDVYRQNELPEKVQ